MSATVEKLAQTKEVKPVMMPNTSFTNLAIVAAIAFGAPLLLGFAPQLRLPATMLEILTRIVLGPTASEHLACLCRSTAWPKCRQGCGRQRRSVVSRRRSITLDVFPPQGTRASAHRGTA
jgi:hypothetical protein